MIITTIFFVIGNIFQLLASFLPIWSVYPPEILAGFTYFGQCLMKLNFLLDMYSLCAAIVFLVQFFAIYYTIRLIVSMISAIRGHQIIDI